jgi:hypothetical protein
MAKTTKLPNLGTKRDSDDDLSPHELPTVFLPGDKPPYTITDRGQLAHSWHEQEVNGLGMDSVDRSGSPDPHVLDQDLAGIAGKSWGNNSQTRAAVRENWGGGAGEQIKMSRRKRGGLQETGDRASDRPRARK